MAKAATIKLSGDNKAVLQVVHEAAFSNPFGGTRGLLDAQIAGISSDSDHEKVLAAALARIRAILDRLREDGASRITDVHESDRDILLTACLFDIFHRFQYDFDRLIEDQVSSGSGTCAVPFATDALRLLTDVGLSHKEACRYFAMFYQLRRAFFFIQGSLVGTCSSMCRLRQTLWNNVFTHDMRLYERSLWNRMEDFSTLLLGETGTGKGAAAAAIGRSGFIPFDEKSSRFAESFMSSFMTINLSQFPETLLESELFGHRKGAFTGAVEAYDGVFARCSPHGAIFLDEIGEVTVAAQIKLLQVIQEREFSPVGSHDVLRFHGRVIAATNRSLNELRGAGHFRDDFFYRLCSDIVHVPSLRERLREDPQELDQLLTVTVARITGADDNSGLAAGIRKSILESIGQEYAWPGNVRELEQCVRRILLTNRYRGDDAGISSDLSGSIQAGIDAGSYDAHSLMADYCRLLYGRLGTYEKVARTTALDRRTVKKYINSDDRRSASS